MLTGEKELYWNEKNNILYFLFRFVANWVDLLLGFLLIILFVALCVSICAYTSRDKKRNAAQRRAAAQRQQRANDPNHIQFQVKSL